MDYANEIIPNLWLGSKNSALEQNNIRKHNIKLIINCSKDINYSVDPDIHVMRLPINDINTEESNIILRDNIDILTYMIDLYLHNNLGVLVHCYAGMQRSATVVICYLMKYKNFKLNDAKIYMKNKRSIVFLPFPTFDNFINTYALSYDK